jgi:hypothetical protein
MKPRTQTALILAALLAFMAGSRDRILYELKDLPAWQRFLFGVLVVLAITLTVVWIAAPHIKHLL